MKKLFVILACCALTVATLTPDTSFAQGSQTEHKGPKDGAVSMKGGKVMVASGGTCAPLTKHVTMANGTTVSADGTMTAKDGTKTKLKDGDMVRPDGTMREKKQ